MRKLDAAGILPRAHLPVGRIDARRVDVDDDFPASGDRVRQVPVLEDLRAAEAAEERGFHPRGEPRPSRSFTSARSTRLAGVGTPAAPKAAAMRALAGARPISSSLRPWWRTWPGPAISTAT